MSNHYNNQWIQVNNINYNQPLFLYPAVALLVVVPAHGNLPPLYYMPLPLQTAYPIVSGQGFHYEGGIGRSGRDGAYGGTAPRSRRFARRSVCTRVRRFFAAIFLRQLLNVPVDPRGVLKLIRTIERETEVSEEARTGAGSAVRAAPHGPGAFVAVDAVLDGVRREGLLETKAAVATGNAGSQEATAARAPAGSERERREGERDQQVLRLQRTLSSHTRTPPWRLAGMYATAPFTLTNSRDAVHRVGRMPRENEHPKRECLADKLERGARVHSEHNEVKTAARAVSTSNTESFGRATDAAPLDKIPSSGRSSHATPKAAENRRDHGHELLHR
ncbi:hypothetical protein FA95DRAFT_1612641 [Auriscalpium vulgare]|uniref:Uncharacterized protein n=1 Tax=Auriscalpium vulgare TaxID=40419 RepID=A0ACB8R5H1_9AGAM|nr:hypothetical protein FA95DRAFT_1612641 [Auriscalpium vulgare]